jgi:quaternary ammonium compound-resistance protein SugE
MDRGMTAKMTSWLMLGASSLFQVGWLVSLREISGFRRPVPLLCYAFFGLASTFLLSRSLEKIPLATAYAVWTGLSVAGALLFESASGRHASGPLRLACILLILAATAGLQLTGGAIDPAKTRTTSAEISRPRFRGRPADQCRGR